MRAYTAITLWAIAIGWAIFWTLLHYSRPATFPWIGVPAGLLIVAPLLVMNWLEQRRARQRSTREQHDRAPDQSKF